MENPFQSFSVDELHRWAPMFQIALHVLLIIILGWALYKFVQRLINRFRLYMALKAPSSEEVKRIDTLHRVFHYAASVVVLVVAGMLILSELGVSIAPILGAAGVVGVAVGFGAQSLVKDYFTGLFLLLENQIRQGDYVEVAGKNGEVEEITLRYMRLRDYEGSVHYIPNSLVTTVTNKSREFAYAVIDIGITYRDDIDKVLETMRMIAGELRSTPNFAAKILDDIEIAGIEKLGESHVTLRARIKVRAADQADVKREFIKRLMKALAAHGIELPYPRMTIYAGQITDGTTPQLSVVAVPKAD